MAGYNQAVMIAYLQRQRHSAAILATPQSGRAGEAALAPSLLLQAVIIPSHATAAGQLIAAVALPWFEIMELILREPDTIYQIGWRKWEEIIAAAYKQQGFEVTLTPRSNDKGRDIIASTTGLGAIRIVEQVKAYKPGHVVTADEVRSMIGVLALEPSASKGLISTTSDFAPGIWEDPGIAQLLPTRLELKNGTALVNWLGSIAAPKK